MKTGTFLLILLVLISSSCKEQNKLVSTEDEKECVLNLRGRKVLIDSIDNFLEQKMLEMNIPGVSLAIINNGKVTYHRVKGYSNVETRNPVSNKTIFEAASTSKPLFAFMIMTLVENKQLDLDKPLYYYLDSGSQKSYRGDKQIQKITARMVLSHTTGLPNWREDSELKTFFEPGTDFSYSGEAYQLLVNAAQSILGTDYLGLEDYFQENVARQMGLDHTRFVQNEYNRLNKASPHFDGARKEKNLWMAKEFNSASGVHTESLDFSKWLITMMSSGILSKKSYDDLFKDEITVTKAPKILSEEGAIAWTLGFAKYDIDGHVVYGHEGNNDGFNCLFVFDRDKKWGMVQLNNANEVYDFGFELFRFINKTH